MQANVKCECGVYLNVRKLIKSGARKCPECGAALSEKALLKIYGKVPAPSMHRRKQLSKITLNCLCGSSYKIERPQGDFLFSCKTCGRVLIQARVGTLNLKGVNTFGEQA